MLKSPVTCHLLDAAIAVLLIILLLGGVDVKWVVMFTLAAQAFGKISQAIVEFFRPIIEALGRRC